MYKLIQNVTLQYLRKYIVYLLRYKSYAIYVGYLKTQLKIRDIYLIKIYILQ